MARRALTAALVALVLAACAADATPDARASRPEGAARPAGCAPAELPPGTPLGRARLRWTADCVPYVRTPARRFRALDGFPYAARHATVDGLRMAYEDVGPRSGEVILLLHGEPSWSYLYRRMIPPLAAHGYRVIALDMMGMGRSDKPVQLGDYSYLHHVHWVEGFLEALDLHDVTAFVQDWGSLVGLRVVGDLPDRFARVVVANGRLPVPPPGLQIVPVPDPPTPDPDLEFSPQRCATEGARLRPLVAGVEPCFADWVAYSLTGTRFRPSDIVQSLTRITLTPRELAAYDSPFPSRIYMSGVRTFPSLINTIGEEPTNERARAVFDRWTKPLLTLFGRLDRSLGTDAVQSEMRDRVPGAAGQAHHAYADANHFIQEDEGADLARRVDAFIRANPLPAPTGA